MITVFGMGRLGLAWALNLEKAGYTVTGIDINQGRVDEINSRSLKTSEPDVENFLKTSNIKCYIDAKNGEESQCSFVIVPTPSLESGKYNHTYIDDVIAKLPISKNKILIISSTVTPGYCNKIKQKVKNLGYELVYNPEFIAQGSIIKDQLAPDIVLLGGEKWATDVVKEIYTSLVTNSPSFHQMSLAEAEVTKIGLNCFLTTKIAFANMIGDLALKLGCQPDKILGAMAQDTRIGGKYLNYGFGYSGECLPRDSRALATVLEEAGVYSHIPLATDLSNKSHLTQQVNNFVKSGKKQKTIEGVGFKKGSDILTESQKLLFASGLADEGVEITIKDTITIIEKVKEKYKDKFKYAV